MSVKFLGILQDAEAFNLEISKYTCVMCSIAGYPSTYFLYRKGGTILLHTVSAVFVDKNWLIALKSAKPTMVGIVVRADCLALNHKRLPAATPTLYQNF